MIESLYFFCYNSFLLGDLSKTEMYYSLLREEFKTHGKKDSLKEFQLLELRKIKEALLSGNIPRGKWLNNVATIDIRQNYEVSNQNDLVKKIHEEGKDQLDNLMEDCVWLYNLEHPCGSYGAVDMVYMGRGTIYPIEVKKGTGEHDLIGQINKYDLYHKSQLIYRHYEHVQSITICGGYNPHVINELKQAGVVPLLYSLVNEKIVLKKI